MWRIVLCLIAFGLVADACAQSERPPPSAGEQGQTQPDRAQQSTTSNPQSAPQPPIVVNVLPTPKTEAERAEEAHERQEKADLDRQLVRFTAGLYYATIGLAVATIFLVIATGGLAVFAFVQSRDMKDSIATANDGVKAAIASNQIAVTTSEQQLRAYVTSIGVNLTIHRGPGRMSPMGNVVLDGPIQEYGFAAILENGGQTPAINVVTNISCTKMSNDAVAKTDFPDSTWSGHGLIGPKGELHTRTVRYTSQEFEPVEANTEWYLWGWVEYDDIFTASGSTSRHRTEFCFQIERLRLAGGTELFVSFRPYSRFNAAEWDCLRPIDPMINKSGPRRAPQQGAAS